MGITPQQFKQLEARLTRKNRVASPAVEQRISGVIGRHETILGVDPSLRGTGYGVIQLGKPNHRVLAQGTISCPAAWEHSRCLVRIVQTLREIIGKHRPSVCAIEGLYFAQNLQTALIMGEARGASLATVAEAGLDIYELAPRKVKQAIVGFGGAQKLAVAKMVQRMLRMTELPTPDAADALALALAHANESSRYSFAQPRKI